MADPFSITAGAIGIAGPALQSIRALRENIQAIKGAPEMIRDLKEDVLAVEKIFATLDTAIQGPEFETLNHDTKTDLGHVINSCKGVCEKIQTKLTKCMKHSADGQIHWRDRVRVGLFSEPDIKVLSGQLNTCKSTVNSAVITATLLNTASSNMITEDIRNILLTKKSNLKKDIEETNKQTTEVNMRLKEVDEQAKEPSEIAEELKDQRTGLCNSRKVLEGLLSDIHRIQTKQNIRQIDMSDHGQLLVGSINMGHKNTDLTQDISNVNAKQSGMGIVGVAEGIDVNAFFGNKLAKP
ncbi:MAG: hypothetical protein M1834_001329 [Cirrosporium novae-zelandiae]|nr:MAG: hypothetical protein M1834_001329 [Cirrosporium novae-zelandiae]